MPIRPQQQYKAVPDKMFEIPQPAIGGLNLKDLEFEQEVNQSPFMKNVMYRNGAFAKRYGQEVHSTYSNDIYATTYYGGSIFVHSGTKIYRDSLLSTPEEVWTGFPEVSGIFIIFQQKLYYMCYSKLTHSGGLYEYKEISPNVMGFGTIDAYIPDLTINCAPDGVGGDSMDDINVVGLQFNLVYNGTENTTIYEVGPYDTDNIIDWTITPTIKVDDEATTAFTVDTVNKKVTFTTAPGEGDMNVVMTFTMLANKTREAKEETLTCKYYDTYGGTYNSRVFLAGSGKSRYYWCASYDISYWPALNYAKLGNTEDDISGFGRQYNALIAFKPRETYQILAYTESTTVSDQSVDTEYFRSMLVNPILGCDAPHSIQVINNLLTWFNSKVGICTLVSTNLADERNIRVLSRNIEKTNNLGITGILDIPNNDTEKPENVTSADFDKKYFLVFPTSGKCFVWDYEISPYFYSSANGETPPARLTWFYFDNIYAKSFINVGRELLYISGKEGRSVSVKQLLDWDNGNWGTNYNMVYSVEEDYVYATVPAHVRAFFLQYIINDTSKTYYVSIEFKPENYYGPVYLYLNTDLIFTFKMEYGQTEFVKYEGYITLKEGTNALRLGADITIPNNRKFYFKNFMLLEMSEELLPAYLDPLLENYIPYDTTTIVKLGNFKNTLIMFNSSFNDLDFDGDGENDSIDSFYLTPFMQFGAVEMLKNVKNLYVQCRGDTNTLINISYYTDDSSQPEVDPEPIRVDGGGILWSNFTWDNFRWFMNIWGNVFRRKCNLKKIEMCAVYFDNNEVGKDMSITHIGLQYQLVKYVR